MQYFIAHFSFTHVCGIQGQLFKMICLSSSDAFYNLEININKICILFGALYNDLV